MNLVKRARETYAAERLTKAAEWQREANNLRAIGMGATHRCACLDLGARVAILQAQVIGGVKDVSA